MFLNIYLIFKIKAILYVISWNKRREKNAHAKVSRKYRLKGSIPRDSKIWQADKID
jgi:hypothetical protein